MCRCWLCQKGSSRPFRDLGPLLHLAINDKGTEMKWLHRQCLLWSPEVSEGRGSELVNVPKAVFRGRHINCKVFARSLCLPEALLASLLSYCILSHACILDDTATQWPHSHTVLWSCCNNKQCENFNHYQAGLRGLGILLLSQSKKLIYGTRVVVYMSLSCIVRIDKR